MFRRMADRLGPAGIAATPVMPSSAIAIVDGAELLRQRREKLQRLAQKAGVMDAHFDTLYVSVLDSMAGYLQQLPFPGDPYSTALDAAIDDALECLGRRQGYQLPLWAETETRAREQDIWTYAVFTLVMLAHVKDAFAYHVQLYSVELLQLDAWRPASGPMPDRAAWYVIDDPPPCPKKQMPVEVGLMLADHFLPSMGLAWLWSNQSVMRSWISAFTGEPSNRTELREIIAPSLDSSQPPVEAKSTTEPLEPAGSTRSLSVDQGDDSADHRSDSTSKEVQQFLEWAGEQFRASSSPDVAGLHLTADGLVIDDKAFETYGGLLNPSVGRRLSKVLIRYLSAVKVRIQHDDSDPAVQKRALLVDATWLPGTVRPDAFSGISVSQEGK